MAYPKAAFCPIVMLDELPQPRNERKISMYADDIALWITGRKLTAMTSKLQWQLDLMDTFLSDNGFRISVQKSCSILFHKNKSRLDDSNSLPAGEQIPMTPTVTFLGIILDEKMSEKAQTLSCSLQLRSDAGSASMWCELLPENPGVLAKC